MAHGSRKVEREGGSAAPERLRNNNLRHVYEQCYEVFRPLKFRTENFFHLICILSGCWLIVLEYCSTVDLRTCHIKIVTVTLKLFF
jgi:hypothetical protein